MSVQKGWRRCLQCAGLFYPGGPHACPRGGEHTSEESSEFMPRTAGGPGTQDMWRWCKRCGGMFYSGLGAGRCVDGNGHDGSGSGAYFLQTGRVDGLFAPNWRWCKLCQVLFNGFFPASVSPANGGKSHSSEGSGEYSLQMRVAGQGVAAVYQGRGNDGTIWMTLRQSSQWVAHLRVPGGCSVTPSPVMYGGKLWIFYQGMGDCRELWFTTFDGSSFSSSQQVPDVRLKGAPCAAVIDGRLTVWVQGTSRSVDLWCITLADPARMTWRSDLIPTANGIWNDPAVVPLPDSLGGGAWVFYDRAMDNLGGRGSSGRIVRLDTKSGVTEDVSVSASGSPGAVMFNSSVYLFHEGKGGDCRLWSTKLIPTDNGKGATRGGGPGRVEAPMRMSAVPAPVVDGGRLYVFTEGPGDNGELWFGGSAYGTHFDGNGPIAGVGCSTGCGATRFRFAA